MIRSLLMVLVVVSVQLLPFCQSTLAETVFLDDFRDGDAQDGNPVTWNLVTPEQTTLEVVDESLVLSIDATGISQRFNSAEADGISLLDTSIRTQLRLSGNGRAGVFGRNLSATITSDGGANFFGLTDIATGLDPLNEDVIIQLDVIGSMASIWVWRVGEPMPSTPLVTTSGGRVPGPVAVAVQAEANAMASAQFRYVAVATTSIPEPSTGMLLGIAATSTLVGVRRRRRSYVGAIKVPKQGATHGPDVPKLH